MTTERDPSTRIVLSWLREDTHENADRMLMRALDEVDTTPQRRPRWPAWRTFPVNKLAMTTAAVAGVLLVAVVGFTNVPGLGTLPTRPTPSPNPTLLARGTFVAGDAVEIEATGAGSTVTGTMTVRKGGLPHDGAGVITVDLQCSQTADGSLILIGGITTASTSIGVPTGSWAGIAFERGSPVEATIWTGEDPASRPATCPAYLDAQLNVERSTHPFDGDWLDPISGTVELGP